MGLTMGSEAAARRPHERAVALDAQRQEPSSVSGAASARPAKGGVVFRAELDLAELDDRGRPGAIWTGRSYEISRAVLAFRSRRMCYEGRELLVAVHLVDDKPTPLFGIVDKSEYDGDGLYRTVLTLKRLPETDAVRTWIGNLAHRARDDRRM